MIEKISTKKKQSVFHLFTEGEKIILTSPYIRHLEQKQKAVVAKYSELTKNSILAGIKKHTTVLEMVAATQEVEKERKKLKTKIDEKDFQDWLKFLKEIRKLKRSLQSSRGKVGIQEAKLQIGEIAEKLLLYEEKYYELRKVFESNEI